MIADIRIEALCANGNKVNTDDMILNEACADRLRGLEVTSVTFTLRNARFADLEELEKLIKLMKECFAS